MSNQYMDTLLSNSDALRLNAKENLSIISVKIDSVNSFLRYIGEAGPGALGSEASWRIRREITQGNLTSISFASSKFDQIWDNRASLVYENGIPPVSFNNTLSTLFDGINDYVNCGDAFNYEHSQQFTVSLWIKPNNFAATRYFIGNVEPDVDGWRIGHDTSGNIITQTRVAGRAYAPTTYTDSVLAALGWNHVVMKWLGGSNNNQTRIYLNGVLSGIIPTTGSMVTTWLGSNNLEIGRAVANYFSGHIDEVTLWNRALTDAEVVQLYNAGDPNNPTALSFAGNLTNWYRMGDGDTFPTILNNASALENGTMTNMVAGAFVLDVP